MPFALALSGINAANSDLNTTANNIANVDTVGFKESRAEFASLFAQTQQGVSQTAIGNGVATSEIAQQFSQGIGRWVYSHAVHGIGKFRG